MKSETIFCAKNQLPPPPLALTTPSSLSRLHFIFFPFKNCYSPFYNMQVEYTREKFQSPRIMRRTHTILPCPFCAESNAEDEHRDVDRVAQVSRPAVFSNCAHRCSYCKLFTVIPVYRFMKDAKLCECHPEQPQMFITQCGIIYDGHAQCGCAVCIDGLFE